MSAEKFVRSRHGSFVSMSNYDWIKEMQEYANQETTAKDAQIKELREALEGMINGTTPEFAKLYGFGNERKKAAKTLEKTKPHEP